MCNTINKNWGPATENGILLCMTLHSCVEAVCVLFYVVKDYGKAWDLVNHAAFTHFTDPHRMRSKGD